MVKTPDVGEAVQKNWISHMLPAGRKNGSITVDHRLAVSLKTRHVTAIEVERHSWAFVPEKWKHMFMQKKCTQIFITAPFIRAKYWRPNVLQWMSGLNKRWPTSTWNITGSQKEKLTDTYSNLHRPQGQPCRVKTVDVRRLCAIWFHLYNILKLTRLRRWRMD